MVLRFQTAQKIYKKYVLATMMSHMPHIGDIGEQHPFTKISQAWQFLIAKIVPLKRPHHDVTLYRLMKMWSHLHKKVLNTGNPGVTDLTNSNKPPCHGLLWFGLNVGLFVRRSCLLVFLFGLYVPLRWPLNLLSKQKMQN